MSYITDAVIHVTGYISPELRDALGSPIPDPQRTQRFLPIDMDYAGGTKVFTNEVHAGAFNYLDREALETWFRGLPWNKTSAAFLSADTEGVSILVLAVANGQVVLAGGLDEAFDGPDRWKVVPA